VADAVTTNVLVNDGNKYVVHLTNICDTTGESGVVKVDKSSLTCTNGKEPIALDIVEICGTVNGFTNVKLHWDHATDDTAAVMTGGYFEFDYCEYGGLKDPTLNDSTGDLLLTTTGNASGDNYDITISLRLRPND
jgi:hypothetical protein